MVGSDAMNCKLPCCAFCARLPSETTRRQLLLAVRSCKETLL